MKKVRIVSLCVLQFVTLASAHHAQEKDGPTWLSQARARQVLEAGIEALGGMENVRRADKITVNYKSVNHPPGQNAAFDAPPADFQRVGLKTLIDYSGGRYVAEGQSNSAGGYKFNFRNVIAPRRSFSIDLLRNRRGPEVRNLDERAKAQLKLTLLSEVPHLLLLYAAQRPETLRWLGEAEGEGQKLRVVSFAAESGTQVSLYFDARTGLLARTEQLDSHAQLGDMRYGNTFSDYHAVGGVRLPRRRLAFVNQFTTGENKYADVRFDFADDEKLLEVPAGYVEPAPTAVAVTEVMRKVGDGLYLIERVGQAYRVMFVEFDDYVMLLEAPTDANVTRAVLRLVRQTAPGKPVRYVSFSHLHFDHTGGLREYVAEGATVVVPPGNRAFVERVAQSKFTLKPDALALNPRPPVVETLVAVHSGAVAWKDFRRAVADTDNTADAAARAGVLVIAHMGDSQVALVDGVTFQTLATLDTGKNPHEVRVSPDGRRAYVAAGKTITAVDLESRKVRATFDLGSYSAHDIRVSRDGGRIWAACAPSQTVLELNADTGKILKTYRTDQQGSWFVEITPDERKIYTPNLEGKSVSVIDRATGEVKIIRFDHPVYGIDITPDGRQVWVSGRDLAVIDTATDRVTATVKTSEPETGRVRLTSDGKRVVVALSKKLAVYDAKTRRLINETELGTSPKVLALSSDDRRAFLTNPGDHSVSVVDIEAGRLLATFRTGKKPDGIGWAK